MGAYSIGGLGVTSRGEDLTSKLDIAAMAKDLLSDLSGYALNNRSSEYRQDKQKVIEYLQAVNNATKLEGNNPHNAGAIQREGRTSRLNRNGGRRIPRHRPQKRRSRPSHDYNKNIR